MKRVKRAIFAMDCIFFSASKPRPDLEAILTFFFRGETFHCFFHILYSNIEYFREFRFHDTRNKLLITFRTSLLKKHDTINF